MDSAPTRRDAKSATAGDDEPMGDALTPDALQTLARIEAKMFGRDAPELRIDRYVLAERVGRGGMGVVHAAFDPELQRRVAIKLVDVGDVADGRASERLQREAQAIARISHPNVVPVYDVGTYEQAGGRGVFLVMELVDGQDLAAWLRERRPWRDVLAAFVAAGRGLAAAHAVGIVHRDFKPGNVLVGKDGRVRVLDFGLARAETAVEEAHDEATEAEHDTLGSDLTRTGIALGTPYYMAPEQHDGAALDARCDQYAFGVALYRALVGSGPFPDVDHRTLRALKREGRAPEFTGEVELPGWLRRVIARAMRPDPGQRYADMNALLAEIERGLASERRRRLAVVGAIAMLATGGIGVALGGGRDPDPGVDQADALAPTTPASTQPSVAFFALIDRSPDRRFADMVHSVPNLMEDELRGVEGIVTVDYYLLRERIEVGGAERDQTARALGAGLVVEGTLAPQGDDDVELTVTLRALDGAPIREIARRVGRHAVYETARAVVRELAETALGRALPVREGGPRAFDFEHSLQLGIEALERFDFVEARERLHAAEALDPDSAEVHWYLATLVFWNSSSVADAELQLRAAERGLLTPAQRAFVEPFRLYVHHDIAAAIDAFAAACRSFPDDRYLLYGMFEAQYHGGFPEQALATATRLSELSPGFQLTRLHLTDIHLARRDSEALERIAAQTEARDPANADVLRLRARLAAGEVRAVLENVEPRLERDDELAELAVQAHALAGDVALALARARQRSDRDLGLSLHATIGLTLAQGARPGRDLARARAELLGANGWAKPDRWIGLALMAVPSADPDELAAVRALYDSASKPDHEGDVRLSTARVLVAASEPDLLRTVERDGAPEPRAAAAAMLAEAAGDPARAGEQWREAMRHSVDARFLVVENHALARVLRQRGEHEAVIAACEQALVPAKFDWSWGAAVGDCLAWTAEAAAALGRHDQARAAFERLQAIRTRAGADDAALGLGRRALASSG